MNGKELKKIRSKMGLTQSQMALLFGMSQQGYSRLETQYEGRRLTKQHIATLRIIQFIYDKNLLLEYKSISD